MKDKKYPYRITLSFTKEQGMCLEDEARGIDRSVAWVVREKLFGKGA